MLRSRFSRSSRAHFLAQFFQPLTRVRSQLPFFLNGRRRQALASTHAHFLGTKYIGPGKKTAT